MTFTVLKPRVMRRTDAVCASLQRRQSHGKERVLFELSFSESLCASLRWKLGEKFEISVGDGTDRGYIRITPSADGYQLKSSGTTSRRPRFNLAYWGDEKSYPSQACEARPDTIARTLIVELPWQKRVLKAVG